jgi:AAA+ superfamily predicted ATPase
MTQPARIWLDGLLPALTRLDAILEQAITIAQERFGAEALADRFRGLHVPASEPARLLRRAPGEPAFSAERKTLPGLSAEADALDKLVNGYGLSQFDLDILLVALAPDLDRRYERIYAFLQNNVSYRKASVDLILNLLSRNAIERLERRVHFASDAPLIRHQLLHLTSPPGQPDDSLLAHSVHVDGQIVDLLLGQNQLDRRLAPLCRTVPPAAPRLVSLPQGSYEALLDLTRTAFSSEEPLLLNLWGEPGLGQWETAQALATDLDRALVALELDLAGSSYAAILRLAMRHAWLNETLLCISLAHPLAEDKRVQQILVDAKGIILLISSSQFVPSISLATIPISAPFKRPPFEIRRALWRSVLSEQGLETSEDQIEVLSSRLRLSPKQIGDAMATAVGHSRLTGMAPTFNDLLGAARAQTGRRLGELARKTAPKHDWTDIILPEDSLKSLQELCQRVRHRQQVLGEWGFHNKLALGKGTNALFSGPSGTGKTMAAGIIAGELGLDLYKIDLSGVVSKYIGETEKNLNRIFAAATHGNAILFFDEADALFGKRSEVRDSHDRYANIEISYLLQKMEEYDGVSILATNLRQHLDDSFVRRLAVTVQFPFPGEGSRRRIWERIWPAETPLGDAVDLSLMARQFKLSGGNIKNVALAAAYLAASAGSPVKMSHLLQATEREYQKMGRVLDNNHLAQRPAENMIAVVN